MSEVFISYAHQDIALLEGLKSHLAPFERLGKVALWTDRSLEVGDVWRAGIEKALGACRVAVLLVSKHFLASDFIREIEMPRLLSRWAAGEVTLIPVFLGHCAADRAPFGYRTTLGEERQIAVTEFQGISRPEKPLLDANARDYGYQLLVRRLEDLVGEVRRETALPSRVAPELPAGIELAIVLERKGDEFTIGYQKPGESAFGDRSLDWKTVEATLTQITDKVSRWRLVETEKWFAGGGAIEDGHRLFDLLFGEDGTWQPVLHRVFGQPATPRLGRVRLRVVTSEPFLLTVPWRLLAHEGRPVTQDDWTIAVGTETRAERSVVTETQHEVLILASADASPKLGVKAHVEQVRHTVLEAWGESAESRIRWISQVDNLRRGAPGLRPHLIYIYGELEGDTDSWRLRLADGSVSLVDLAGWIRPSPEALVLVTAGVSNAGAAVRAFERPPSFLLARALPSWREEIAGLSLRWLGTWLKGRRDPLEALHELTPSLETATCVAVADYRIWTVDAPRNARRRSIRELLDRVSQKGRAALEIDQMIESDRRLLALLGYMEASGGGQHASDQLFGYLEQRPSSQLRIQRVRVEIPDTAPEDLHRRLGPDLEMQLERGDGESITQMLRRHGPRTRRGPKVLWLDWGFAGGLKKGHLRGWLRFCHDYLTPAVPEDLRVVSFLALEVDDVACRKRRAMLQELHSKWRGHHLRFVDLPPFDTVPEPELWDFLDAHTDCPAGLRDELSQRLHRETGGEFEATVGWLEQAERESWTSALEDLRRLNPDLVIDDEEDF